jgi:hypothetical protein
MGNGFVEFGHYAKCFAAGFWRLVCPSLIVNQEILDAKTETAVFIRIAFIWLNWYGGGTRSLSTTKIS